MNDITINGTVRGPEGDAIGSALLTLISPQGQQLGRARTCRPHGFYQVTAPARRVRAHHGGGRVAAEGDRRGGWRPGLGARHFLPSTSGLTGVARAGADGEAVAGAMVVVTDDRGEVLAGAKTGDNGVFTFEDLPAGTFTIAVNATTYRPRAIPVEIGGQGLTRVEVALAAGARLQGIVRAGEHRRPLRDARVTLVDAHGEVVATATTGEDGRYAFTDLEAADYTLIAGGYPPACHPAQRDREWRDRIRRGTRPPGRVTPGPAGPGTVTGTTRRPHTAAGTFGPVRRGSGFRPAAAGAGRSPTARRKLRQPC